MSCLPTLLTVNDWRDARWDIFATGDEYEDAAFYGATGRCWKTPVGINRWDEVVQNAASGSGPTGVVGTATTGRCWHNLLAVVRSAYCCPTGVRPDRPPITTAPPAGGD